MKEGLGTAFPLLEKVKMALDPYNLLNPGKLGLLARAEKPAAGFGGN